MNWYSTGLRLSALAENKLMEIQVSGKKIGITRRADQVFAFAALCPHQSAPLCDGWVDPAGRIVCPLHKYRFDPVNGRNTTGEGYKLFTYRTEVRDDELFVALSL
jgi:3-phenylpropionate/trans-cinnamate dioxygenase ferredoxin subunit